MADGPAVAEGRLRVPARQRRGAGRQPALRPRHLHRPVHAAGGRGGEQPLQPRRLHARPPLAVRAQQRARRRTCGRTCTSPTCRTTSRVNDRADAEPRPALRVRDADVGGEQRPVELRSGDADDGRGQGRIDLRPRARRSRSQQLRPAARLRVHADAERPSCAAAGASATCTSTASASATCCRSTGRRSINAVVNQTTRPTPASVPTEQGYPAGLTDPSQFNPLTAQHHLHPARLSTRARCRAGTCRCSASSGRSMLVDVAYVGNRANDLLLVAQLQPGGAEQRRRHDSAAGAPADSDVRATSPTSFNGGKSRYDALQIEVRVADARRRVDVLSSLTLSKAKDNGAGVARERERQLPGAAGLQQPRRRLRHCPATTSRTTARRASSGRCRSGAAALGRQHVAGGRRAPRRLAARRHQHRHARRAGDVHLHAGRGRSRCPASRRTSAARTTTGRTSTCDPYAPSSPSITATGSTRRASSLPTDPEPAVRQRARATACAGRTSGSSTSRRASSVAARRTARAASSALEAFNLFNRDNFTRAERQPQLGRLRHDHVDLRPAAAAARRQSALVVRQSPS